jgi:3-deoxy-D-manno-octulosonate 8-phosphate phosphatase (KDO 8-P phosphatase)
MVDQGLTLKERARRIRVLIFDVDGVLTDGSIWLFPAPVGGAMATAEHAQAMAGRGGYAMVSETMIEAKAFNAQDGSGVSLARLGGIECAIITKRISEAVALRARDMRVRHVYQGQSNKMEAVRRIMEAEGVTLEEIAYLGDDLIDLPVMRVCGLAVAVGNARRHVKEAAHWVTPSVGGHGAARDAVEFLLEARGVLDEVVERYVAERSDPVG